jgi:sorting nexin-1/2
LPGYNPNTLYQVLRRFSDFEWLLTKLNENQDYKGLIIPSLPEKKYVGNMNNEFIEKRREDLENFLRVLLTHTILKYD